MGYINPDSGTHFYEATDPLAETTIATVLNAAQQAEHNARLNDRQRLTNLEDDALMMHTITPSGFMTVQTGVSFQSGKPQTIRRMGPRVEFSLRFQKSSGAWVHGESVGYLKYEWRGITNAEWQLVAHQAGGGQNANNVASVLLPDGNIIILDPSGVSNVLAVSGFYHMV